MQPEKAAQDSCTAVTGPHFPANQRNEGQKHSAALVKISSDVCQVFGLLASALSSGNHLERHARPNGQDLSLSRQMRLQRLDHGHSAACCGETITVRPQLRLTHGMDVDGLPAYLPLLSWYCTFLYIFAIANFISFLRQACLI